MGATIERSTSVPVPVVETTLLELVRVVSEVTEDDREVVTTVMEMLRSRRVRLCGPFRDSTLDAA
jgi:predicted nucleic-acid-binding protein